jgi:hypothetical protein
MKFAALVGTFPRLHLDPSLCLLSCNNNAIRSTWRLERRNAQKANKFIVTGHYVADNGNEY